MTELTSTRDNSGGGDDGHDDEEEEGATVEGKVCEYVIKHSL